MPSLFPSSNLPSTPTKAFSPLLSTTVYVSLASGVELTKTSDIPSLLKTADPVTAPETAPVRVISAAP